MIGSKVKVIQLARLSKFCLVVELHRGGSPTKMAILCLFHLDEVLFTLPYLVTL